MVEAKLVILAIAASTVELVTNARSIYSCARRTQVMACSCRLDAGRGVLLSCEHKRRRWCTRREGGRASRWLQGGRSRGLLARHSWGWSLMQAPMAEMSGELLEEEEAQYYGFGLGLDLRSRGELLAR